MKETPRIIAIIESILMIVTGILGLAMVMNILHSISVRAITTLAILTDIGIVYSVAYLVRNKSDDDRKWVLLALSQGTTINILLIVMKLLS